MVLWLALGFVLVPTYPQDGHLGMSVSHKCVHEPRSVVCDLYRHRLVGPMGHRAWACTPCWAMAVSSQCGPWIYAASWVYTVSQTNRDPVFCICLPLPHSFFLLCGRRDRGLRWSSSAHGRWSLLSGQDQPPTILHIYFNLPRPFHSLHPGDHQPAIFF